jgi:hypothetical protein
MIPAGIFQWYPVQLEGGTNGRTTDLTFSTDTGAFWRFAALVLT